MKQLLWLVLLLAAPMLRGEIVNADFSRELESWIAAPPGTVEAVPIPGGVRLKVVEARKSGDGAISQRIRNTAESGRLAVSVHASGEAGYLQVKTYRNGRELERFSSDGASPVLPRTLRCEFPLNGVDSYEICLRMKLNARYVGAETEFRALRIEPVRRAPVEVVPLYCSASYYCDFEEKSEPAGVKAGFRRAGETAFRPAWPPQWDAADRQLRGSIVDLEEDTEYELKFEAEGREPHVVRFRTWKSEVPVAKTVDLSQVFNGRTFVIDAKGTPQGYIRYTMPPGSVLAADESGPVLELRNAAYILLDGLTLRGGGHDGVEVKSSHHIRIRNCDISGWGVVGEQRFDRDGKFYGSGGEPVNYTAGIRILSSSGVTVERCRIHEPRNRANPWFFSHPAGPQALYVGNVRECVVRWNDFIGCARHRWNDVIEGWGNFNRDGGFERDCDIYGNLLAFGNDDGVELDGGQMNVRFFDNWIEGTYCGVSTCGCMRGPSYAFRNLVSRLGDEMLGGSSSFKSGRSVGMLNIFNNTLLGGAGVSCTNPELRAVTRNNVIQVSGHAIREGRPMPGNSFDYDLCYSSARSDGRPAPPENVLIGPGIGAHIDYRKAEFVDAERGNYRLRPGTPGAGAAVWLPNFSAAGGDMGCVPDGANWPPRPGLAFTVDAIRLDFGADDAPEQGVTLTAKRDFSFRITKNGCFGWFRVEPERGTLRAGESLTLSVRPVPEAFTLPGTHGGGFSIRQSDGFSRPVLVYAKSDRDEPVPAAVKPGLLIRNNRNEPFTSGSWDFDLAEGGAYYLVLRFGALPGRGGAVAVKLDGKERTVRLRTEELYNYPLVDKGGVAFLAKPVPLRLEAGRHTLELSAGGSVRFELAVLTRNPWPFFTRFQQQE
ncbi:MAG: right-handed parallel beta-helix repeat-containing protein [Lentisphaeria bacterium]|nr:right-handed parallel beta-helix repeat-containing protein [Lentisphaeria bacterium]